MLLRQGHLVAMAGLEFTKQGKLRLTEIRDLPTSTSQGLGLNVCIKDQPASFLIQNVRTSMRYRLGKISQCYQPCLNHRRCPCWSALHSFINTHFRKTETINGCLLLSYLLLINCCCRSHPALKWHGLDLQLCCQNKMHLR